MRAGALASIVESPRIVTTVQHETVNVTLNLPDDLCREARHRAVDEDKSLSAWLADLVARELQKAPKKSESLLEMLGDPATADRDFPLPERETDHSQPVEFP
jgi:hypothetical protein